MTRGELKHTACRFCEKYAGGKSPDIDCIYDAMEDLGYTVVEYCIGFYDEDTDKLIKALKIPAALLNSGGFTYSDKNVRCVFVNDSLSNDEKRAVAAHELGHIVLHHMEVSGHVGRNVGEEHDASVFADMLTDMPFSMKLSLFCTRNKKALIISTAILTAVIIGLIFALCANSRPKYTPEYYVTATGEKYHLKTCKYIEGKNDTRRLTEDEFKIGIYEPCKLCLPDLQK